MNECNGTVEVVQATAEALAAGVHEGVGSRSEDEVWLSRVKIPLRVAF